MFGWNNSSSRSYDYVTRKSKSDSSEVEDVIIEVDTDSVREKSHLDNSSLQFDVEAYPMVNSEGDLMERIFIILNFLFDQDSDLYKKILPCFSSKLKIEMLPKGAKDLSLFNDEACLDSNPFWLHNLKENFENANLFGIEPKGTLFPVIEKLNAFILGENISVIYFELCFVNHCLNKIFNFTMKHKSSKKFVQSVGLNMFSSKTTVALDLLILNKRLETIREALIHLKLAGYGNKSLVQTFDLERKDRYESLFSNNHHGKSFAEKYCLGYKQMCVNDLLSSISPDLAGSFLYIVEKCSCPECSDRQSCIMERSNNGIESSKQSNNYSKMDMLKDNSMSPRNSFQDELHVLNDYHSDWLTKQQARIQQYSNTTTVDIDDDCILPTSEYIYYCFSKKKKHEDSGEEMEPDTAVENLEDAKQLVLEDIASDIFQEIIKDFIVYETQAEINSQAATTDDEATDAESEQGNGDNKDGDDEEEEPDDNYGEENDDEGNEEVEYEEEVDEEVDGDEQNDHVINEEEHEVIQNDSDKKDSCSSNKIPSAKSVSRRSTNISIRSLQELPPNEYFFFISMDPIHVEKGLKPFFFKYNPSKLFHQYFSSLYPDNKDRYEESMRACSNFASSEINDLRSLAGIQNTLNCSIDLPSGGVIFWYRSRPCIYVLIKCRSEEDIPIVLSSIEDRLPTLIQLALFPVPLKFKNTAWTNEQSGPISRRYNTKFMRMTKTIDEYREGDITQFEKQEAKIPSHFKSSRVTVTTIRNKSMRQTLKSVAGSKHISGISDTPGDNMVNNMVAQDDAEVDILSHQSEAASQPKSEENTLQNIRETMETEKPREVQYTSGTELPQLEEEDHDNKSLNKMSSIHSKRSDQTDKGDSASLKADLKDGARQTSSIKASEETNIEKKMTSLLKKESSLNEKLFKKESQSITYTEKTSADKNVDRLTDHMSENDRMEKSSNGLCNTDGEMNEDAELNNDDELKEVGELEEVSELNNSDEDKLKEDDALNENDEINNELENNQVENVGSSFKTTSADITVDKSSLTKQTTSTNIEHSEIEDGVDETKLTQADDNRSNNLKLQEAEKVNEPQSEQMVRRITDKSSGNLVSTFDSRDCTTTTSDEYSDTTSRTKTFKKQTANANCLTARYDHSKVSDSSQKSSYKIMVKSIKHDFGKSVIDRDCIQRPNRIGKLNSELNLCKYSAANKSSFKGKCDVLKKTTFCDDIQQKNRIQHSTVEDTNKSRSLCNNYVGSKHPPKHNMHNNLKPDSTKTDQFSPFSPENLYVSNMDFTSSENDTDISYHPERENVNQSNSGRNRTLKENSSQAVVLQTKFKNFGKGLFKDCAMCSVIAAEIIREMEDEDNRSFFDSYKSR